MNAHFADLSLPVPFESFRAFRADSCKASRTTSFGELDLRRLGGLTIVVAMLAALIGAFAGTVGVVAGPVSFVTFLIAFGAFVVGVVIRNVGTYRKLYANERRLA